MWFEIPSSFAPSPFPSLQPNFSSSFWPNLESSANISKWLEKERKKEREITIYLWWERNNYKSVKLHYYSNQQRLTRKIEIYEFYMYVFTRNSLKDSTWNSYGKIISSIIRSGVIRLDSSKYQILQFCMAFFYNKDKQ